MRHKSFLWLCLLPLAVVTTAFFLLPMARLVVAGAEGPQGLASYLAILTEPRYRATLINTVLLAAATTIATLVIATIAGMFLQRHRFAGRAVLIAMLTFPLAFPGVVVGFLIILLAGRQGLIGEISNRVFGEKIVFAYSIYGLFLGYLYFSIPRVILTIMAAVQKLDTGLEEAARSLGASPWAVQRDVVLPALGPAFVASGAIAFATAMGAFGTAFTLATNIDVLPMLIYTEFTLAANFATSAALSVDFDSSPGRSWRWRARSAAVPSPRPDEMPRVLGRRRRADRGLADRRRGADASHVGVAGPVVAAAGFGRSGDLLVGHARLVDAERTGQHRDQRMHVDGSDRQPRDRAGVAAGEHDLDVVAVKAVGVLFLQQRAHDRAEHDSGLLRGECGHIAGGGHERVAVTVTGGVDGGGDGATDRSRRAGKVTPRRHHDQHPFRVRVPHAFSLPCARTVYASRAGRPEMLTGWNGSY